MPLKFCPKCGSELEGNIDFCSFCGADLRERKEIEKVSIPKPVDKYSKTEIHDITPEAKKEMEKKESSKSEFADFFPRLLAFLLDLGVVALISFVFLIFLHRIGPIFFVIFIPLISFFYFWLMETITNGQTIGKKVLNLRTVNADTLEFANVGDFLLNNLLKCTPLIILDLILGFLLNLHDPKKRIRLFQNISNTAVIKTK